VTRDLSRPGRPRRRSGHSAARRNASGKSTTLKTILGLVRPCSGVVEFDGEDVTDLATSRRIAMGMAIVPENRRLFAPLTVEENLELGAYLRNGGLDQDRDQVFELFPRLHERRHQIAGTLSARSLDR
jgi:branched-chain amino acid transport system ATP-binding protein